MKKSWIGELVKWMSRTRYFFFCQFAEPFGKGYLFISWPRGLPGVRILVALIIKGGII